MTANVYNFPVRRPNFVNQAQWNGPDDDLSLIVGYLDETGTQKSVSLTTSNANEGRIGDICLPDHATVNDIPRDTLVAHIRMATFISKTVAGSVEWETSFVEQEGSKDFQLAIGTAAVVDFRLINDTQVEIDLLKKNDQVIRTFRADHSELSNYSFTPSTQLLILGGALKLEYPNYVHNYPDVILDSTQRANIIQYVMNLNPWV